MTLIFTCCIDIQSVQDHFIQQYAMMIQNILAHMISSWEDNKYWAVPKESMTQKYSRREQKSVELIHPPLKTTLIASDMELSLMVEEALAYKELLCFTAGSKTSEIVHYFLETLKELLLDLVNSLIQLNLNFIAIFIKRINHLLFSSSSSIC